MSESFQYWWDGLETGHRVRFALLVLGLGLLFLPFVVGYALPFGVLSGLVGYGWLRASYVSLSERNYARVALLIPVTAAATVLALEWARPAPRNLDLAVQTRPAHRSPMKGDSAPAPQPGSATDICTTAFNAVYLPWYGSVPLIGPVPPATYNFDTVRWIVLCAILLGAPAVFWGFHFSDEEQARFERQRKYRANRAEYERSYEERLRKLERRERELERRRGAIENAISERDREIERLRQREKYFTEGLSASPVTGSGAPDLGYL